MKIIETNEGTFFKFTSNSFPTYPKVIWTSYNTDFTLNANKSGDRWVCYIDGTNGHRQMGSGKTMVDAVSDAVKQYEATVEGTGRDCVCDECREVRNRAYLERMGRCTCGTCVPR